MRVCVVSECFVEQATWCNFTQQLALCKFIRHHCQNYEMFSGQNNATHSWKLSEKLHCVWVFNWSTTYLRQVDMSVFVIDLFNMKTMLSLCLLSISVTFICAYYTTLSIGSINDLYTWKSKHNLIFKLIQHFFRSTINIEGGGRQIINMKVIEDTPWKILKMVQFEYK